MRHTTESFFIFDGKQCFTGSMSEQATVEEATEDAREEAGRIADELGLTVRQESAGVFLVVDAGAAVELVVAKVLVHSS